MPSAFIILPIFFAVYGLANYYIGARVLLCVSHFAPGVNTKIYWLICAFLAVLVPVSIFTGGGAIKNVVNLITNYWLGLFIYLLLTLLAADIIVLIAKIFVEIPHKAWLIARMSAIIVTVFIMLYGTWNAASIRNITYDITIDGFESELKAVLVSDIHIGAIGSEAKIPKMVEAINGQNADIVLISGDLFDNDYGKIKNPDEVISNLSKIDSKYGVFACLGNHDGGSDFDKMMDMLEKSGVRVLKDESIAIDGIVNVIGRLDSSPIGGAAGLKRSDDISALLDEKMPNIILDHNPMYIDEYDGRADLVLSGHTHKGQIFPGSIITGAMYDVDHGHYQKDENSPQVIVTSGIGTWGMPMRVGTTCEVVTINMNPGEEK